MPLRVPFRFRASPKSFQRVLLRLYSNSAPPESSDERLLCTPQHPQTVLESAPERLKLGVTLAHRLVARRRLRLLGLANAKSLFSPSPSLNSLGDFLLSPSQSPFRPMLRPNARMSLSLSANQRAVLAVTRKHALGMWCDPLAHPRLWVLNLDPALSVHVAAELAIALNANAHTIDALDFCHALADTLAIRDPHLAHALEDILHKVSLSAASNSTTDSASTVQSSRQQPALLIDISRRLNLARIIDFWLSNFSMRVSALPTKKVFLAVENAAFLVQSPTGIFLLNLLCTRIARKFTNRPIYVSLFVSLRVLGKRFIPESFTELDIIGLPNDHVVDHSRAGPAPSIEADPTTAHSLLAERALFFANFNYNSIRRVITKSAPDFLLPLEKEFSEKLRLTLLPVPLSRSTLEQAAASIIGFLAEPDFRSMSTASARNAVASKISETNDPDYEKSIPPSVIGALYSRNSPDSVRCEIKNDKQLSLYYLVYSVLSASLGPFYADRDRIHSCLPEGRMRSPLPSPPDSEEPSNSPGEFDHEHEDNGGGSQDSGQPAPGSGGRSRGSQSDGKNAMMERIMKQNIVRPSDVRESLDDVIGHHEAKLAMRSLISLPLQYPHHFASGLLSRFKSTGVLLYGPPGTGKTLLAKAVAHTSKSTFFAINPSNVFDKYVGESEKFISCLFECARKTQPCVIFVDEVDSLFSKRDFDLTGYRRDVVNEFCLQWDGVRESTGFVLIGSTNRPFDLDEAVLRRFARRILVDLPNNEDKYEILARLLTSESVDASVSLEALVTRMERYSGSDIKNVCVAAAMAAIRELETLGSVQDARVLQNRHFDIALTEVLPSVSKDFSSVHRLRNFAASASRATEKPFGF